MKALLLITTSLAGLAMVWPGRRARQGSLSGARRQLKPVAPTELPSVDVSEVTRKFLLGFVLPLWMMAGVADWLCHRASAIEATGGAKESLIHLLMLSETALPTLAALFLEITSPVLALMITGFLLHDATALWDVSYAVKLRDVTPIEQHVHSFLEMVPLMAVAFVSVLHWPQLLALFGIGDQRPDWSLRLKEKPLPWWQVGTLLAAMAALEWAPYLEELWRTLRTKTRVKGDVSARLPAHP